MCLIAFPNLAKAQDVANYAWKSETTSFGKTNWNTMYKMDNIEFNNTLLTINYTYENEINDSKCESDYCLIIKQYDENGNKTNELYLQNVYNYLTANVIDNYLYTVVKYKEDDLYVSYIEKYDSSLKKVVSYKLGEQSKPDKYYNTGAWNSQTFYDVSYDNIFILSLAPYMVNMFAGGASVDGYSAREGYFYSEYYYDYYDFYQIHEENNNIVVYSLNEDYVFDKDLTTMTTKDNSWKEKYGKNNYSYNFIDDNNYLVAGSTEDNNGFLKLITNEKEALNITNEDYYSFDMPIKVGSYYVVLGQSKEDKKEHILIFENNNLVQNITSENGDYWNLRALNNGFAVINTKTSVSNYANNNSGSNEIYTEVYKINEKTVDTENKGLTVTVPPTYESAFIYTLAGVSIITIVGITIYALVKPKKTK